jgi:hypothetical protein
MMTRHAVLILAWAALDVVFVAGWYALVTRQERALAARQRLRERLGRALDRGEVVSLNEWRYSMRRRSRRRA